MNPRWLREPQSPQAVVPVQNGFRDALLRLSSADEAQLSETVEMAGLTDDHYLLRAVRMVAQYKGLESVVERSVMAYCAEHGRTRYVQKLTIPNEEKLAVIT